MREETSIFGHLPRKPGGGPTSLGSITADDVFLEECDGYPWAAKEEGDPARLAFKRNLTSPRRFRAAGSTPKVKGFSRIDGLFEQGSQEYRYVPCPECGHMQKLVFGDGSGAGIRWEPRHAPTRAWYQCENGCEIDEEHKPWMDEQGEWRADNPAAFPRHRSFHIWAAYSQHPGAAWLEIAREFLEVRHDPNLLRTFVNQVLGEAWAEKGEAPEWQRLYDRREKAMQIGTPPSWTGILIGSADVQRGGGGRIDLDIWAFGPRRQRAFVERIEIDGAIADAATWEKLVAHPNANRGAAPSAADTTVVVEPNGETRTEPNGTTPAQRAAPSIAASRILELCGRSEELGSTFAGELIRDAEAGTLTEASMQQRIADRLIESRARPSIDARAAQHGTDEDSYRQALADAVTLRATPNDRLDDDPSRPAAQRIAAARDFRGMTMMEMARFHLGRTGTDMRGMGRLQIAGEALGLMRGGALTTSDFANALSFAANRRVRAAFAAAPQTFRQWVGTDTLPDFKPSQIIGLGDAPALLLVPENGEFQRGALADTGLTYRLQTYGRIIPITRQAIVNDDKQLFGRIPTMFGRKAADLESDLVYGTLLSNPTMGDGQPLFSVAAGNLAATGSQITVNSVAAGETAMLQQKNDEGGAMTIRPEFLIVGPLQKVAAQAFLTAVAAAKTSDVNPYPGNLQLVVESRITGYQWFLSASPDAFDTIVLAHLDGQEELFTETRVGFDVDGVEEKARLDVGAAAVDRRGLYRNPGASPY